MLGSALHLTSVSQPPLFDLHGFADSSTSWSLSLAGNTTASPVVHTPVSLSSAVHLPSLVAVDRKVIAVKSAPSLSRSVWSSAPVPKPPPMMLDVSSS